MWKKFTCGLFLWLTSWDGAKKRDMFRISGLRNDVNKRTFCKERKINNRYFDFLSKQNIIVWLILDINAASSSNMWLEDNGYWTISLLRFLKKRFWFLRNRFGKSKTSLYIVRNYIHSLNSSQKGRIEVIIVILYYIK